MAHYNLYDSLSLDSSADPSQLVADIDAKLAQLSPENAAARDELTTAREIFSVDNRRTQYDQELTNPTGPEVDIARIRDIAALPAASATGSSSPAAKHAAPPRKQPARTLRRPDTPPHIPRSRNKAGPPTPPASRLPLTTPVSVAPKSNSPSTSAIWPSRSPPSANAASPSCGA